MIAWYWLLVALFVGLWMGAEFALTGYFSREINDMDGI